MSRSNPSVGRHAAHPGGACLPEGRPCVLSMAVATLLGGLVLGGCVPPAQTRPTPDATPPAAPATPARMEIATPAHAEEESVASGRPREGPPSLYVVKAGDTLWRIARNHGTTPAAIAAENRLPPGAALSVGQELRLPSKQLAPAAAAAGEAAAQRRGSRASPGRTEPAPFDWPLTGVLYARFGPRGETRHDGIDIATPEGTVVQAAGDGKVLFSGEQRGYGHVVILEHRDGLLTIYSHNAQTLVSEGVQVKKGEPIAKVGPGGSTSGPHLHFEVRDGSRPKDPLLYLPPPR